MDTAQQSGFWVAEWRVSPGEGTLCRHGRCTRLEPLAMGVLVYLAARRGEVVSHAELEEQVWHGGGVGYDAVAITVTTLREALHDNEHDARFIATVPKRGYRLIAAVTPVAGDADATRLDMGRSPAASPGQAHTDRAKVALLIAVLAALAALAWLVLSELAPTPPPG